MTREDGGFRRLWMDAEDDNVRLRIENEMLKEVRLILAVAVVLLSFLGLAALLS